MARLDRLAPVKELAQIGAVIGREFSHELLAAVADRPQEQLENWLDQLVASELVFRRGSPPDAAYSFKHDLVKDAAYQSLLKSRRQQPHARIAHVFEERFPAVVETQPELLAYHLTEAGLDARAADAWARAGRAALGRSAMREAANSLSRAVGLLRGMSASPDRQRLELELLGGLGVALTNTLGRPLPKLRRRTSARISCPRNLATARPGFALAGTSGASTTRALTSKAGRTIRRVDRMNPAFSTHLRRKPA
jgi:predicted ATPase